MYKKILYSFMALSLTLMPSMEVMADITGDTTLSADTVVDSSNEWTGGKITNGGYTLTIQGTKPTTTSEPNYLQTDGGLVLINSSSGTAATFSMIGADDDAAIISGGAVQVGESGTGNTLTLGYKSQIDSAVQVTLNSGNTININNSPDGTTPTLTLSNYNASTADVWKGTIKTTGDGILSLEGFTNNGTDTSSIYQQTSGSLQLITAGTSDNTEYWINNTSSYIDGGSVLVMPNNTLVINSATTATDATGTTYEATLGEGAIVNVNDGGNLAVVGTGTAVLNDVYDGDAEEDIWSGNVVLGSGEDDETPVLSLRNVQKDLTSDTETATLIQNGGTLNIESNANGGSDISGYNTYSVAVTDADDINNGNYDYTTEDENGDTTGYYSQYSNFDGTVNVKGNSTYESTLSLYYNASDIRDMDINLLGNANLNLNTIGTDSENSTVIVTSTPPTGYGDNNTVTINGSKDGYGSFTVGNFDPTSGEITPLTDDVNLGYNLHVAQGDMTVYTNGALKIGLDDPLTEGITEAYGDLMIGDVGNTTTTNFYTTSASNTIVGNLMLYDGTYNHVNPAITTVGGDFYNVNSSGIDMMNGTIDKINIAGDTKITDGSSLGLKIDVDPAKYTSDSINASSVITGSDTTLNLTDYNLLSMPRRSRYTFHVVNGNTYDKEVTSKLVSSSEDPTTSASRIISTTIGDYKMMPSATNGAFDLALFRYNPSVFRRQVAQNVIYANQNVINNQLFDRMIYSNLPYFNGRCTNKTAAADTLYSPYQYTTEDTGLWFKPYANFETIHMTSGLGKVRNNAYGAMIGVDFSRKDFGSWSFIPSVFVGYNGGRVTYNGVGMWHNGGQAGLMGTLTNRNFVTSMAVYGGGYHNSMDFSGVHEQNALWNAGVASKTAYNIHLFWDLILQPTLYMAYNYVGSSNYDTKIENYYYKARGLNAFSIAPGVNLIWQKETFSIYALFQTMFNINAKTQATIAEFNLPDVAIRDPYFEYGLGATKYFKDRFSGYGQVTARSGSRKGVGFQLGLNVKI